MFRSLFLLCLLVMSMGCSTLPGKDHAGASDLDGAGMDVIGQTPLGASFALEQDLFQVIDEYTAASGRDCRRLLEEKSATTRVACRGKNDSWYLRQALSPKNSSTIPVNHPPASNQAAVVMQPLRESVDIESAKVEAAALATVAVAENENLWRFAKRVTGNALNWQAIAETNSIDNVNALRVGQKLRIPVELRVLARAQTRGE